MMELCLKCISVEFIGDRKWLRPAAHGGDRTLYVAGGSFCDVG